MSNFDPSIPNINALKKVKANYIKEEDYHAQFTNGFVGGLTTRGEMIINFFLEESELPSVQFFSIIDGKMGPEVVGDRMPKILKDGVITLNRKLVTGVIMSFNDMVVLHTWLGQHIENARNSGMVIPKIDIATNPNFKTK